MIGMPEGPHLPEPLIFDQPARVSLIDDPPGRSLLGRECRRPDPIRTHRLRDLGPLPNNGPGLLRSDHPDGPVHGRPGGQVLHVPDAPDQRAFCLDSRRLETEQPLGVLEKLPTVVLEDDQDVLSVAQTKPDERGTQVKTVGDDEVEGAGIVQKEAAEKTEGAGDLVFPFPLKLHVQEKRNILLGSQGPEGRYRARDGLSSRSQGPQGRLCAVFHLREARIGTGVNRGVPRSVHQRGLDEEDRTAGPGDGHRV